MITRIIASIFIVTITAIYNISIAASGYHYHKAPANCVKINSHQHPNGDKPHKHRLRCTKSSETKQVKLNTLRPVPKPVTKPVTKPITKPITKQARGSSVPVWSTPVIHRQNKTVKTVTVKKIPPASKPVVQRPVVQSRPASPQPVRQSLSQQPQSTKVVKQATLAHWHPAIPRCTRAVKHSHKFQITAHKHSYSCQKNIAQLRRPQKRNRQPVRSQQRVINGHINMAVIRREVRATGIYHGPINSVVSPSTRQSLRKYKK
ncbi:MAG TPA: hypothetical protein EYH35_01080 [Thiotrichaceae bacterium]|nr:hypothetical protein [Thiotrichaceae bacterium]